MANKIDCFTNTGVAKLDPGNDDRVQLVRDSRGITDIHADRAVDPDRARPILTHRLFPRLLQLRKLAPARLVISFLPIFIFRIVESFFAATGRGIVGIERKHLLVFLVGQIVAAGLVVALGVSQQPFHFLDFGDEFGAHRAAKLRFSSGRGDARASDANAAVT